MNAIEKNAVVIQKLKKHAALLDAILHSLRLYVENYIVVCELIITPRRGSFTSNITIRITGVNRFDFYFDAKNQFYIIDRYKLFARNNGEVYLSLDPRSEDEIELNDDCGVIIGSEITLEIANP